MSKRPHKPSYLLKVMILGSLEDFQAAMSRWSRDYARAAPVEGGALRKAWVGISRLGAPNRDELLADALQAALHAFRGGRRVPGAENFVKAHEKLGALLDAMQFQMDPLEGSWKMSLRCLAESAGSVGSLGCLEMVLARCPQKSERLALLAKASREARRGSHDAFADEMSRRRKSIIEELSIQAELRKHGSKASEPRQAPRL